MARLIIVTSDGTRTEVDAPAGMSVMEIIRDAGIDELPALCGGCCSCSTCHVKVDSTFVERLTPMNQDEDDLLDGSSQRDSLSRLSCQLQFEDALDGLIVTVVGQD